MSVWCPIIPARYLTFFLIKAETKPTKTMGIVRNWISSHWRKRLGKNCHLSFLYQSTQINLHFAYKLVHRTVALKCHDTRNRQLKSLFSLWAKWPVAGMLRFAFDLSEHINTGNLSSKSFVLSSFHWILRNGRSHLHESFAEIWNLSILHVIRGKISNFAFRFSDFYFIFVWKQATSKKVRTSQMYAIRINVAGFETCLPWLLIPQN